MSIQSDPLKKPSVPVPANRSILKPLNFHEILD